MKKACVVDIDETLINTDERRRKAWEITLKKSVPLDLVKRFSSKQILKRLAPAENREELWFKFWRVLLCIDPEGLKLLKLDKPIPHAPETLSKWAKNLKIIYLTGRTSNMHRLTLKELERMGFPTKNIELVMANNLERYLENPVEERAKLFSTITKRYTVIRVVDDNPNFFPIYKKFDVPERIGLLRPERYKPEDYIAKGATKIAKNWQEINKITA